MSVGLQSALFFLLGYIGLGAVGLLPYRSWRMMQLLLKGRKKRTEKALNVLALAIIIVALWADFQVASRIHQCLNDTYCGPSVASGWIYLSMLGVVCLAFELISHLIQRAHRAVSSNDPIGK